MLCAAEVTLADFSRVMRRWGVDDGLVGGRVEAITQAPDGTLWIGTEKGLFRFRGQQFERLPTENMAGIEDRWIGQVIADNEGTIWIRTRNGRIGRLEGDTFVRVPVPFEHVFHALWNPHPEGGLIVGIKSGRSVHLLRLTWDGVNVLSETLPSMVDTVHAADDGTIWVGCNAPTSLEWTPEKRVEHKLPFVGRFLRRRDGSLLAFGTAVGFQWNGTGWVEVVRYPKKMGSPAKFAMEDLDGRIWFGNRAGDHFVWEGDQTPARFAPGPGSLPGLIMDTLIDQEGDLWFATLSGLFQARYVPFVNWIPPAPMPTKRVNGLRVRPDGTVWFHGFGGACRLVPGTTSPSFEFSRPPTNVFTCDAGEDGSVWRLTRKRVFKMEGEDSVPVPLREGRGGSLKSLVVDSEGVVWVTDDRLYRCDPRGEPLELVPVSGDDGLPDSNHVTLRLLTDQSLLAFVRGWGLFRRSPGSSGWDQITPADDECAMRLRLADITEANGVWGFTREEELCCWVDGHRSTATLDALGLGHIDIGGLVLDEIGGLWMATLNHGVLSVGCQDLRKAMNDASHEPTFQFFDQFSGLGSLGGGLPEECLARGPDGRIWVATDGGLSAIQPRQWAVEKQRAVPPQVRIDALIADGTTLGNESPIRIPPGTVRTGIHFSAMTFAFPREIRYRHRVSGVDDGWVESDTDSAVAYRGLMPGDYQISVVAASRFGAWGQEPATLSFTVLPHWWQRMEVRVAIALLILGLASLFYQMRMSVYLRRQEAQVAFSKRLIDSQESERKRIAGELHDGLGQHLLLIKNSTEFARRKLPQESPVGPRLEEVTSIAADALAEVRAITGNLRPTALDRFGLRVAAQSMAEQIAEHGGIEVDHDLVEIEQDWDDTTEIAIYRFIQETLNNAIKHAEATRVSIDAKASGGWLRIDIVDNGKGFDPEAVRSGAMSGGLGLTELEERAKLMRGEIVIDSTVGSGTTVHIEIPLP